MPKPSRLAPFLVLLVLGFPPPRAASATSPTLIVQITIDQLRGDMPLRFKDRFGPDGFRYLMDKGVAYINAHYLHANTFTAVGHATLATGGHTAQHGVVGNNWFDVKTGQPVYCVEDAAYSLIGKNPKDHRGVSPRNLLSSTFSDELVLASGAASRVFSVSIKDRGAIIPGGHMGKAFWYDTQSGQFVTSTYYYKEYPEWVERWNAAKPAEQFLGAVWTLLHDQTSYVYGKQDARPFEGVPKVFGPSFPHTLPADPSEVFFSALRVTPSADELTLAFVKELVKQEKLGQGHSPAVLPDMLAISFSATDAIGHTFGPHSLEYEDNLLRLDATLADLFAFLDQQVGLANTLIVLSADHGVSDAPEYMQERGFAVGRLSPKEVLRLMNTAFQDQFNRHVDFVLDFQTPSLYLNRDVIAQAGLTIEAAERTLAEHLMDIPGIAHAVTRTDLLRNAIPDTPLMQKVQRAFHPQRSGNVVIVQEQFWFLHQQTQLAAMHGSPYTYDTHVPIMFAGPGITPQIVSRSVAPADVAPTLSALFGIIPPSGSTGTPLVEVVQEGGS